MNKKMTVFLEEVTSPLASFHLFRSNWNLQKLVLKNRARKIARTKNKLNPMTAAIILTIFISN